MRDYESLYSTAVYLRDHLGSTRLKIRDCGEVVGEYDYLPYGGLASYCPLSGLSNDYLFGGKELESSHNVSWYDSGARYQTTHGVFTSQDPLAEKYYSISPYAYCAGNPVNSVDPDGKVVWFIPLLVKGAVGAAIDAGTQVAYLMIEGNSFKDSLGKIGLTSVGTAFVSSVLLSPGASKGAKAAMVGLNFADAAVDYTIEDRTKYIGGGKNVPQTATDLVFSFAPGISSNKLQKAAIKDYTRQMAPSVYSPMTKYEQQQVRRRKKYVESEGFADLLDWLFSFYFEGIDNCIIEVLPKSDKPEEETNKQE